MSEEKKYQTIQAQWEKSFDLLFIASEKEQKHTAYPFCISPAAHTEIKRFIHALLKAHDNTLLARVERMRLPQTSMRQRKSDKAYNQAIDDVKTFMMDENAFLPQEEKRNQ